jgi:hypothetical protein
LVLVLILVLISVLVLLLVLILVLVLVLMLVVVVLVLVLMLVVVLVLMLVVIVVLVECKSAAIAPDVGIEADSGDPFGFTTTSGTAGASEAVVTAAALASLGCKVESKWTQKRPVVGTCETSMVK